jgi:hypothetical protein
MPVVRTSGVDRQELLSNKSYRVSGAAAGPGVTGPAVFSKVLAGYEAGVTVQSGCPGIGGVVVP